MNSYRGMFVFLTFLFCTSSLLAVQSDIDFDTTFGDLNITTGKSSGITIVEDDDGIYSSNIVTQEDGKIIAGGYVNRSPYPWETNLLVGRFNPDGTLDSTFNGGDLLEIDEGYNEYGGIVGLQSDNKIIVAGFTPRTSTDRNNSIFLFRVNTNGTIDTTFADNGMLRDVFSTYEAVQLTDMIVDKNDNILITGDLLKYFEDINATYTFAFSMRYDADGTQDVSFANSGISDLFVVSDRYVMSNIRIIERNNGGYVLGYSYPSSTVGLEEGDYAVLDRISIRILGADGYEDEDYPNLVISAETDMDSLTLSDIKQSSNGLLNILTTVYNDDTHDTNYDIGVYRLGLDGTMDSSFGVNGFKRIDLGYPESATSLAITPNNKLVVGGRITIDNELYRDDFLTVRLNQDGTLDETFSGDGVIVNNFVTVNSEGTMKLDNEDILTDVIVQKDGKILGFGWAGEKNLYLVRYKAFESSINPSIIMYLLN